MEKPIVQGLNISRVLNVGYALRQRLEAVAAREGMDGTTLGRRIIAAGLEARERTQEAGKHE